MKKTHKIIAVFCLIAMLVSTAALTIVNAAEYVMEKPREADKWEEPHFDTDHAYSFAFVGDTQFITIGDYLFGTEKLKYQYKFIADTAEERKLEHVFVLGDMTDWGYRNDGDLASAHNDPPITGEWEVVKAAISQLDGVVPYSLVRGNHDDYMMDDYFNVPEYTDLFEGCGGFFADLDGKNLNKREKKNPDNCIYWSAVTGCHTETIVNSWKTVEIYGTKYLFITYDYNPTYPVLDWMDDILSQYPDHKAIITTHSYLKESGKRMEPVDDLGNTNNYRAITGSVIWDKVLRKHENVFMVVSGHTGNEYVNFSYDRGDNGNKVLQVLVDPQAYETRETDRTGTISSGKQDVGLVLYMNFSEDGKRISFNNYSTLLGKFLKEQSFVINLDGDTDEDGYIDMAAFADGNFATPTIENATTVELDGVINDGEYGYTRTIAKEDIANGAIAGDLTEYFAYDDSYLYYAFKTVGTSLSEQKIKLHFGSTLYDCDQLNRGDHAYTGTYKFSDGYFKLVTTDVASTPITDQDLFCNATFDSATKTVTYELKIRRGYLRDNGSPDDLLSYTLMLGEAEHYYTLTADAKAELVELGVTAELLSTYNYAYFGERPEAAEIPTDETEAPVTEAQQTTEPVKKKKGCNSSLAIASIAFIPVLAGVALVSRKRKDD